MTAEFEYLLEDGGFMDAARGLHWYCVHYHGGQWSDLYSIQCQLRYSPDRGEDESLEGDDDFVARDFYEALERGDIDPHELLDAINQAQERYNG